MAAEWRWGQVLTAPPLSGSLYQFVNIQPSVLGYTLNLGKAISATLEKITCTLTLRDTKISSGTNEENAFELRTSYTQRQNFGPIV
ncbi:hypothetical protein TURU_020477 [Turdus rufiventris]|nr:hypothetical protein TURU_020477 [Turdus rufiventris]